jgi:hypothetical protein
MNGWRTSGLIQHRSGDALTAFMGSDNSLTGLTQDRAAGLHQAGLLQGERGCRRLLGRQSRQLAE